MRRTLTKATAMVFALVAAVCAGVYFYLRQSLPLVEGTIGVPGLSGPVDIVRDQDDIPHIFAATKADALFGLGYAHAQDRLWQMEFQRRIGFGRLSEIFGEATLPDDRFLRTIGFGRAARSAWERLPADARRQIDAYVSGVNAFIGTHRGRQLPPEFSLLQFEPAPWTGPDVLVWAKMMAWDLSENYRFEMMRHDLAARVGVSRMKELLPPYPADGLNILSNSFVGQGIHSLVGQVFRPPAPPALPAPVWSDAFDRGVDRPESLVRAFLLGNRVESLGSNNWVVDGTLTASGKPLLANDPHLATHMPSLWYLAHMSAGDFDVIGATLPGIPAVAIGRNRFIAWGETNAAADVEDLYRERIDANTGTAEYRGTQEPIRVIRETIAVKGAAPVGVDVRITRHGPMLSDAINANNAAATPETKGPDLEPLAFRWTALDDEDQTIVAFLKINEARNWTDFTDALRLFATPSQNFVYADVNGHIGYYAPGRIPIRASGDGTMATDGWTGETEWAGWIPFNELPHALDPPEHFIVTANNRPMPLGYPHFIADEYPEPYRAQRITDLIRGRTKLTPDDFRAIQADTVSLHAQTLVPLLLAHAHPQGAADRQAVEILKGWNFDARADSAASAIFQAWFFQLEPTIVGDELGEPTNRTYDGRFSYITRFVTVLLSPQPAVASRVSRTGTDWCDDVRTAAHETCDDAVTKALHDGVVRLSAELGSGMTRWRWDSVHRAIFPHQGLDAVALLRPLLSRSMPNGGDWSTVDVGPVDADHPFNQIAIPGYRQIVDLSPANDNRFLDAVGQSGHFLSTHYADSLQDWREVRHRKMRMDRADIEKGETGTLRLVPKAAIPRTS